MTLSKTIKDLKFDYVNSDITAEHFPKEPIRGEMVIKHFDRELGSDEVIAELAKEDLVPANLYELLAYAKEDWNGQDFIVALGSSWVVSRGYRHVPCLDYWDAGRRLCLDFWRDGWYGTYRFAAVRKSLDTGTLGTSGTLDSLTLRVEKLEQTVNKLTRIINL